MSIFSNNLVTFSTSTKAAFLHYLCENPNKRRITHTDKDTVIEWLTNIHKRPTSQKDFSRRNYILRTFFWDEKMQKLFARTKSEEKNHLVVTENQIADVVELVHESNKHGGWDATWRDINSSYHGILRSDVIHLPKQCQICALNASKRPKGYAAAMRNPEPIDRNFLDFLNMGDVQDDASALYVQKDKEHSGE